MVIILLIWLVTMAVPVVLLFVVPVWAAVKMRRRGMPVALALVPLLLPAATVASELYAKRLVRKIAEAPVSGGARPEPARSIYAYNGFAPDAVRLIAEHPGLAYTEGTIDANRRRDGSVFRWERLPVGHVRFSGRRRVSKAEDCGADEVSVPTIPPHGPDARPQDAVWHCTRWQPVARLEATHEMKFETRDYRTGPFRVFERRDYLARRSDGRPVNMLISANISGGIWWHLTEWFGDVTSFSALGAGSTVGPYGASTHEHLRGVPASEFLVTGRH
jgi:hypothetical protein